jgi:uncharacterized membrane protein YbhN (UPF0104 family)
LLTRVGLLILKILVVVLIGWVFWPQFRWNEFADALARTSGPTALAVLTLFWFQAVMAALRWRWILRQLGHPLTTGASVEAWLVGQCASQILPAVVGGDAARIIRLRRYHVPTTNALVSVVIDRFAGFVALVVLSAFTVPMLTAYKTTLIPDEIFWAVGMSCLLVAIVLLSLRWTANTAVFRRIPRLAQVQAALRALRPTKEGLLLFTLIGLGTNMTVIISAFLLGRELNPLMDRDPAAGVPADVYSDLDRGLGRSRGPHDERLCAHRRSSHRRACGLDQTRAGKSGARPDRRHRLDRAARERNRRRTAARAGDGPFRSQGVVQTRGWLTRIQERSSTCTGLFWLDLSPRMSWPMSRCFVT